MKLMRMGATEYLLHCTNFAPISRQSWKLAPALGKRTSHSIIGIFQSWNSFKVWCPTYGQTALPFNGRWTSLSVPILPKSRIRLGQASNRNMKIRYVEISIVPTNVGVLTLPHLFVMLV